MWWSLRLQHTWTTLYKLTPYLYQWINVATLAGPGMWWNSNNTNYYPLLRIHVEDVRLYHIYVETLQVFMLQLYVSLDKIFSVVCGDNAVFMPGLGLGTETCWIDCFGPRLEMSQDLVKNIHFCHHKHGWRCPSFPSNCGYRLGGLCTKVHHHPLHLLIWVLGHKHVM